MTTFVRTYPVLTFFALAFAGSWIMWLPWYLTASGAGIIWVTLPASALLAIRVLGACAGPFAAALLAARIADGPDAPARLLGRIVQWRFNPFWYVVALVAVPMAAGAGYVTGFGAPGRHDGFWSAALLALAALAFAFTGPLQEETGWRGFALPRLQQRMHPALAAVVLGLALFAWQLPMMVTTSWDRPVHDFTELGIYLVFLVCHSIVLSAIRNLAGGSLLPVILAASGVSWALFAATVATAGPLPSLIPATCGMGLLAGVALACTGGRLGAGTPDGEPLPAPGTGQDAPGQAATRALIQV